MKPEYFRVRYHCNAGPLTSAAFVRAAVLTSVIGNLNASGARLALGYVRGGKWELFLE